jgi:hypothetical protein
MKVRLTKIKSNHNNLRTDVIEGHAENLPILGEDFFMHAAPLAIVPETGRALRFIRTTPVTSITEVGFNTANSEYKLEVLDANEDSQKS